MRPILIYGLCVAGVAIVVLNTELLRAYSGLRVQASALVGTPVDWPLIGFAAHSLGLHGGAWDGLQWAHNVNAPAGSFGRGMAIFVVVVLLILYSARPIWRAFTSGFLTTTIVLLIAFTAGIVYFRYFVPAAFSTGKGHSWNQFKFSDWMHPFTFALVLAAIASLRLRLGKVFPIAITGLFVVGLVSATTISVQRIGPLMHYFRGVTDVNQFYQDFRGTILRTCGLAAPIYLSLQGADHKFRQTALNYLYDREVRSDWTDDVMISPRLVREKASQQPNAGDCIVELAGAGGLLSRGTQIGPFWVAMSEHGGTIRIGPVSGTYGRETDGPNWWHWIERKAVFKLQALLVPKEAQRTLLRFEYATRGAQTLTVRVLYRDGRHDEMIVHVKTEAMAVFQKIINLPPAEVSELTIETDGTASPLGNGDPRVAAMVIRNVSVSALAP